MKKFVISAPTWFPQSGGITVLHKLAHSLNELGYDAYLAPSQPHGFGWHPSHMPFNTPSKYHNIKFITEDVYKNLHDAIVIYPETWYGNYLNAPNVVRWIMGAADPNYMSAGNKYGMTYDAWGEKDIWFWYSQMYTTKMFNSFDRNLDNILCVIEFHREIFKNTGSERVLNCWSLRKATGKVDPSDYIHDSSDLFLGDVDKTLPNPDFDFAGKYRELAKLFNKTKLFYSYDVYTFVSMQAVMCGTDSIVVPMRGLSKEEYYNGSQLHRYIAYGKEELDRAKLVRNELENHLDEIESDSIQNIHTFVEKCYDYFK